LAKNDDRPADRAAHEYLTRIHAGEPREGLLVQIAAEHGIPHQELSAAIVRFALEPTNEK